MATRNSIGFLGRVPIDTVLVDLLDAVSKGEIQGAAISDDLAQEGNGSTTFPLLDRYNETTSSKVWKEITTKVVSGVERRRTDIASSLSNMSI